MQDSTALEFSVCRLAPRLGELAGAQILQNGAIRAVIATTCFDQLSQRRGHLLGRHPTSLKKTEMILSQQAHLTTGSGFVAPQRQQLPDLFDREAKNSRALDEAQLVDIDLVIAPVAVRQSPRWRKEADALVMTDQLTRDTGQPCRFANLHHSPRHIK